MQFHAVAAFFFADFLAFFVEDNIAGVIDFQGTSIAMEGNAESGSIHTFSITAEAFPCDLPFIRKLERDYVGICGLLVIIERITSTRRNDAGGIIDTESPAAEVDGVDPVISEFAIAVMPDPVPVVMQSIGRKGLSRRRALPEFVIHMWGNWSRSALADSAAGGGVPASTVVDISDRFVFQQLNSFAGGGTAAALITHLHAPLLCSGCLDQQFAFVRIVAAGFFNVGVLTGIAGHDAGRGMPVIRRCANQCVHFRIIQNFAEIGDCLNRGLQFGRERFLEGFEAIAVDIADVPNFDIRQPSEDFRQSGASAGPHHSDDNFLGWAVSPGFICHEDSGGQRCCGATVQKGSSGLRMRRGHAKFLSVGEQGEAFEIDFDACEVGSQSVNVSIFF